MDLPALRAISFLREWTSPPVDETMLAQEWTRPHGEHAGLQPSWLAYVAGWLMARDIHQDGRREYGTS